MERAERFIFLSIGLAFGILVPVLWVMLALTAFTAADRFRRVYQQADRPQRSHTTIRRTGTRTSDSAGAPGPIREWWESRRVDGGRRRHRTARRSRRP